MLGGLLLRGAGKKVNFLFAGGEMTSQEMAAMHNYVLHFYYKEEEDWKKESVN